MNTINKSFFAVIVLVIAQGCYNNVYSCPVWKIGKLYVIDQNGKPIAGARVWNFVALADSYLMKKNKYDKLHTSDSNAYEFWSRGYMYKKVKLPDKAVRIQAQGFADVIIKTLNFSGNRGEDFLPVLKVTMYSKAYITRGNLTTLVTEFVYEKELLVTDTTIIRYADYVQSFKSENKVSAANRTANLEVSTFPNPVIDKLYIQVNKDIFKPYKAKLIDVNGKELVEMELYEKKSEMDMQWQVAGMYVIQVYDPEGVLLYSLKFLKS